MSNIALVVTEAILGILWCYSLYAVLNTKKVVQFTVERSLRTMKFYGFKASIVPTKKTTEVLFKGHLLVLLFLTVYLIFIPLIFR
jgi:hypothetical protein